ncbi:flagellar protein FlgN [Roseovarius aestuariivivens]|uniref:flagellar protein FlgN n=1 Tax=Roseovarius aestuariivivens TaxID=1888910 RepID=UPI001081E83D|nr:flagellar protein FlgN [Roseovarius aestuariivivens]
MTTHEIKSIIDELGDLLDAEREALLGGDLTAAAALVMQKEHLFEALNALQPDNSTLLEAIHSKVSRNQKILEGALQGIRAASTKLAALRRVRRKLETYGQDGRRHTIDGEVSHKVEKRA